MLGTHRWLGAAAAIVSIVAVPATASAVTINPMTITVAPTAQLSAHLLVAVSFQATCDPLGAAPERSGGGASIEQSVLHGSAIATGSGDFGFMADGSNLIVCDGAPHSYDVQVVASPAGPPFRRGNAVVRASAFACVDSLFICAEGSSAWTVVHLVHA
jgi:hypothetical protein